MTWERRLRDLLLAGGALAAVACSIDALDGSNEVACGNANPDPCVCGRTGDDGVCRAHQQACESTGGTFSPYLPDGGIDVTRCLFTDAGSDASRAADAGDDGGPRDAAADADDAAGD